MIGTFIQTPNGVKATEKLNNFASVLEKTDFVKNHHFDLDFDARWCLQIFFKNTDGFIAMKEYPNGDTIQIWVYKFDNDLEPEYYELSKFYSKSHLITTLSAFVKKEWKKM
jgi:hypothetical protein